VFYRTITLPATLATVAALALASCGGGSSDAGGSASGDTNTSAPATTETPRPAGTVGMKNIKFVPEKITVKAGEKVTWTNDEEIPHDVAATSGAKFKSEVFGKGGTFTYTPTKAGTIKYECTLHPGMVGELVVEK
jgi:plastocyanin